jgi:hypothetical protein
MRDLDADEEPQRLVPAARPVVVVPRPERPAVAEQDDDDNEDRREHADVSNALVRRREEPVVVIVIVRRPRRRLRPPGHKLSFPHADHDRPRLPEAKGEALLSRWW